MLIDTGSTDTLIDMSVYHQIPKEQRPELETCGIGVRQVDGSPLQVCGSAWVDLKIGKTVCPVRAVFADIPLPGMLGMNWLLAIGGSLDLHKMELNINGERIKCTGSDGESFVGRVVVTETTVIPPGHEVIAAGTIVSQYKGPSGPAIIEPVEYGGRLGEKGLILARTLVTIPSEVVPIRILNPNKEKRVVRAGTTAAMVTPIEREVPVVDERRSQSSSVLPRHLVDLYGRSKENLNPSDHEELRKCLIEFEDVFSRGETDIGHTDLVMHGIDTGNARPVKQRPRRHPVCNQQEIDRQIKDLKSRGLIEPSDSPWAANVVLVKKKDGSKRLCIDYRGLNAVTIKDAYPVPRIDDTLDALEGAKWFSTLDLASGYWQVALDEEARQKSSFVVRGGLYRWKVMPFGLSNAPATFERLMEKVLSGLQWETLLVYLDDVIVFGKTVNDEMKRLRQVFERLRKAGLKLKPSKCNLFQRSVTYLGHVVSAEGVTTDPAKVRAVSDWPTPKCVRDVRSFLGLASYYRRFIRGFATIASPLHSLTSKSKDFVWNEACQDAFKRLKEALLEAPVLVYPLPDDEFILDTDASNEGIGAVLSQVHDGVERVVAYASRKLSKAERNYCVTRKELLAVVAYLKYFRQYLYGRKVVVRTDHSSLRWLMNFKEPEGQLARWIEIVSEYDVTIQHRPGAKHANADGLSRQRCRQCTHCSSNKRNEDAPEGGQSVPKGGAGPRVRATVLQPSIDSKSLREAQLADSSMSWVLSAKEEGNERPQWSDISSLSPASKTYWSYWEQLSMRDGVLHQRWESDDGNLVRWRLVVPEKYRDELIRELHGGKLGGHLGLKKTLAGMKQRYYWSGMTADVRSCLRQCDQCARKKPPPKRRVAPLQQYNVGGTMDRVAMDLVGPLPRTEDGNQWILVVGDYATRWIEAYALPDAKAETVATKFVCEFVCRFGIPKEMHTDRGTNFESELLREVCRILGISKTRTTAYNPKSDGLIERFNKTLITMVSMMIDPHKNQRDWDKHLPFATSAYRCTPQESLGESPNMMMLGREVLLPVDLTVDHPDRGQDGTSVDYAKELRGQIQRAHERAQERAKMSLRRQKKNYDRRATDPGIRKNEFVWLFNPAKRKGVCPKLQLKWEGPYLVLKKLSDVVFRIQRAKGAKPRVVHADRLKPYRGEPLEPWRETLVKEIRELAQKPSKVDKPSVGMGARSSLSNERNESVEMGVDSSVTHQGPDVQEPLFSRYPKRAHRLPVRFR